MNEKLPVIRIKNAWLLREKVSVHLHELWGKGEDLVTYEETDRIVRQYCDAWMPYEQRVLEAMTDILGLQFRQNYIDVYIAPWFYAFSDPMVIGVGYEPDRFVDVLTHELLHRLLTDSTSVLPEKRLVSEWQKLFGKEHSHTTVVHIPVHAVHTAIYLDYLKEPQRLERDKAMDKKYANEGYVKSWGYVGEQGYKEIIEELKRSYRDLAEKSVN
jgi:hypothetical protein